MYMYPHSGCSDGSVGIANIKQYMYPLSGCSDGSVGIANCAVCDDSSNDGKITATECLTCRSGYVLDYKKESCKCKVSFMLKDYRCLSYVKEKYPILCIRQQYVHLVGHTE